MQSNNWRGAIDHVSELAKGESCTLEGLELTLGQLATELGQSKLSGLAFITTTAAQSCKAGSIEPALARFAIVDLCERLLAALETSQPFDFSNASTSLTALLFPEEIEEPVESAVQVIEAPPDIPLTNETALREQGVEICLCNDGHLLSEFFNEASEHIQCAEQMLLKLENDPLDQECIDGLFRAVHSLKGISGVLELKSLGEISHLAESVLVRARDGKIVLRGTPFTVTLAAVDAISGQISSLSECFRAKRTLEYPVSPHILLTCLEEVRGSGRCSQDELILLKSIQPTARTKNTKKSRNSAPIADTLRVDGKRLELLMDLVGELVITDALVQRELHHRENALTCSVATRLRKVVREVQQLSLTLKMVPIGTVFQKMNRIVRDLSAKLNKQVELQIFGADTEVDRTLLECITDPLVHMIRNSLDHGIEATSEERIAAGKPTVASILLKAEHHSGHIHVLISDDGRGLNRERILARAIERGLVDSSTVLTEAAIDNLIFEPGFSTASEVTEISGRGVGMDVVRRNVESLRGSVSMTSRPGLGTDIRLILPLTLSIIDGTIVRIGERFFIIPTLSVVEQVQLTSLALAISDECNLVRFRSRFLSIRRLGEILNTPHSNSHKHGQVVMIVDSGGKQHALIVDEVLGQQPVVIKPLGSVLEGAFNFAGGALLSDGQIGFVLDLNSVCNKTDEVNLRLKSQYE